MLKVYFAAEHVLIINELLIYFIIEFITSLLTYITLKIVVGRYRRKRAALT